MIKLPAIFKNHMVLQRDKRIEFWGESNEEKVSITFLGRTQETKVNNGAWEMSFPPQKAGGPYELIVQTDSEKIKIEDVYVGEVWLAGGQSNMEFEIHKSNGGQELLEQAKAYYQKSREKGQDECLKNKSDDAAIEKREMSLQEDSSKLVRFYQVSRIPFVGEELEKAESENGWQVYGCDTMDDWSAVGFYFAREVAAKLGVMVGIIGCNWGGTSACCWMSPEMLKSKRATTDYMTEYEKATEGQVFEEYLKDLAAYKAYQSVFEKNVAEYYQTAENPTWDEALELFGENLYPGPMGPRNERRPGGLYETMLSRVMPYTIRGFLYYQAEEDDHRPYTYGEALESVIAQWRRDWKDSEMPFYYVMLPMFADVGVPDYKNWAFLREAQINVNKKIKNTGMANPFELGELGNIHPTEKVPVGQRLSNLALCQVYGFQELETKCNGPRFKDFYVDGKQMHLSFSGMEDGLLIREEDKQVRLQEDSKQVEGLDAGEVDKQLDDGKLASEQDAGEVYKQLEDGRLASEQDAGEVDKQLEDGKLASEQDAGEVDKQLDDGKLASEQDANKADKQLEDGSKLVELREGREIVTGFELAGEDGNYVPATAILKNNEIILQASEVAEPKYARYLWTNYAEVLLFGKNGIPMEPFRTSNLDGAKATGSRQGYIIAEDLSKVENS